MIIYYNINNIIFELFKTKINKHAICKNKYGTFKNKYDADLIIIHCYFDNKIINIAS